MAEIVRNKADIVLFKFIFLEGDILQIFRKFIEEHGDIIVLQLRNAKEHF